MENAKKMIIVPIEAFQRVQNQQQTSSNIASGLDNEMLKLLNNTTLSDREKWDQYQQVLQRFLHFASQKRKPINIPVVDMNSKHNGIGMEEIVDTFSKTYKKDVRNLVKALEKKNEFVSWDEDGVITINGEKIPNSNIVDVLHDIIRARKSTQPPGWKQLMMILKETNTPSEFITNPFSREYLSKLKGDQGISLSQSIDSTYLETPSITTSTPARRNKPVVKWEPFNL